MATLTQKRQSELRLKLAQAFRNQYLGCGTYKGHLTESDEEIKNQNKYKQSIFKKGIEMIQEISDELKEYGMYIDMSTLEFIKDPFAKKQ